MRQYNCRTYWNSSVLQPQELMDYMASKIHQFALAYYVIYYQFMTHDTQNYFDEYNSELKNVDYPWGK